MQTFKRELTAALTAALANAATDQTPNTYDARPTIVVPVQGMQLTLFNSRAAIQEVLSNVNRIPGSSPMRCSKSGVTGGTVTDEGDVALDIYGDAATAADKLQGQLDRAEDLGLDAKQQGRLAGLIANLRDRAAATTDPARQRSAIVNTLIAKREANKEAADKAERAQACAQAVEAHPEMPALKRLIAEHEAKNAHSEIKNHTTGDSPLAFCTRGSVSYAFAHGGYKRNTKHNPAIRALQETIARSVGAWNYRAKCVDMARFAVYAEAA